MKKNLFIDITILAEYKGNLTGISRTIYNATKEIILGHTSRFNPQFLCFSALESRHRVLSYSEILAILGKISPSDLAAFEACLSRCQFDNNPRSGDWCLALGEQWLYKDVLEQLADLKINKGIRIASFIHDLTPLLTRQYFYEGFSDSFEKCILKTLEISDVLFSNSIASKCDIEQLAKMLHISVMVRVLRLGDHVFATELIESKKPIPESNFILCTGTLQPRKNHLLLVYVWKMLAAKLGARTPQLVLIGGRGWHMDPFFYLIEHDSELRNLFVFKTNVNDAELVEYYRKCRFTVYPSFYEGWGLPIAESVSLGKFCIASKTSSMPEIAGDLIEYHNPFDSGELYELVLKYTTDDEALRQREAKIRQNYVPTLWKTFTKDLISALDDR